MKKILFISFLMLAALSVQAQKYLTKAGYISFFSSTPIEDITAENNQVVSILNVENGELVFQALMKSFQFEKALMQEHFNEKYVHSDKFPKAIFKGKIANMEEVNFSESGTYTANIQGELTIHGVTKPMETEGKIEVKDGEILAEAAFPLTIADWEIKIPSVVRENIAEQVETKVKMKYKPFGK
ncbi:MAG: YceI family protein [Bacteroidota bacterium]